TQNTDSGSANGTQSADPANEVVSDGGSTSNVAKTIENPDWKPVGTSQTGKHAAVYDSNSVDWQEMLNAISAATGVARDNMTVWRIGSNQKDPNHSIATISSKDDKKPYRVYIEWVDGQGWKPTKVEELSVNDKGNINE
ncbi:MAG: YrrS family protein, partial [Bacillota bacterium]|nr:YrrS family protein [Bacillota bacterium]